MMRGQPSIDEVNVRLVFRRIIHYYMQHQLVEIRGCIRTDPVSFLYIYHIDLVMIMA